MFVSPAIKTIVVEQKLSDVNNKTKKRIICRRKNRKTKTMITLHRNDNEYILECEGHGYVMPYSSRQEAVKYMSKPDEWCPGCIEGWEVDSYEQ